MDEIPMSWQGRKPGEKAGDWQDQRTGASPARNTTFPSGEPRARNTQFPSGERYEIYCRMSGDAIERHSTAEQCREAYDIFITTFSSEYEVGMRYVNDKHLIWSVN